MTVKPGDPPGEGARRAKALERLDRALAAETSAREAAAVATRRAAEEAAWLGASLADLASVTGHSRQAARKRWPTLGGITRRRRWLSSHVEDILHTARLILQDDKQLDPIARAGLTDCFTRLCMLLSDDQAPEEDASLRWRMLEQLVDTHLRAAADPARGPAPTDEAQFARDGAGGVVAYYDHILNDPSRSPG
ncbi:hypothetical protein [Ornithinimicrobium panacihumi]|uniref:hypothetical protein n=1 Tax=Ornithinimicrobium panacihumi TaxID=2008449 RepID=UPI003F8A54B8